MLKRTQVSDRRNHVCYFHCEREAGAARYDGIRSQFISWSGLDVQWRGWVRKQHPHQVCATHNTIWIAIKEVNHGYSADLPIPHDIDFESESQYDIVQGKRWG